MIVPIVVIIVAALGAGVYFLTKSSKSSGGTDEAPKPVQTPETAVPVESNQPQNLPAEPVSPVQPVQQVVSADHGKQDGRARAVLPSPGEVVHTGRERHVMPSGPDAAAARRIPLPGAPPCSAAKEP